MESKKNKIESTLEAVQYAYKNWIEDVTSPPDFKAEQIEKCKNEIDYLQNELKKYKDLENES